MEVCASLTGCTSLDNIRDNISGYGETAGTAPMPVEELGGEMPIPVDETDGDMPIPVDETDGDIYEEHTAGTAETSLNVPATQLEKVLDTVNDFIVDIKDLEPSVYKAYTGAPIVLVLQNLSLLSKEISPDHVYLRVPKIPEYNTKEHIQHSTAQLKKMGFQNIEVFSYII